MVSPAKMQTTILTIMVAFSYISKIFVSGQYANFNKLELPVGVKGPGGLAFRNTSDGPYVTTLDGRIMKWNGTTTSFEDFGYTSSNRTKELCDGVEDHDKWSTCGRPLAITYSEEIDNFYIADAYLGILIMSSLGDLATELVVGFKFANGLDVIGAHIFFSDASLTYDVR